MSAAPVPTKSRWYRRRPVISCLLAAGLAVVVAAGAAVAWVQLTQRSRTTTLETASPAPVAIALGAGIRPDGTPTLYLERRLEAARVLLEAGTVSSILITGSSLNPDRDEIASMRTWLVGHGVDPKAIIEDGYGIDTHDSCVRAHDILGIDQAIVVTQDYHLPRALFLCEHAGIDSQGVGVSATGGTVTAYRLREVGASIKAALEVLLGTAPTHEGEWS